MALKIPKDLAGRLELVGRALYGTHWRKRLAEGLKVSRSTLHLWLGGTRTDRDLDGELIELMDAERDACSERSIRITDIRRRMIMASNGGADARA
ncbi:hypothetical protein JQ580_33400 [Bradyrhizobium japonicum]|uniref:hypothetical protein n=1 Tax=Bradyrhizobium japonicum TaxID=375 RepID=UPI001BAB0009|nr:hypothetical protein [Bradyrhizobium japonicum]MBR0995612.1 hypothetical protein [Bradyrhizobium japonicum]